MRHVFLAVAVSVLAVSPVQLEGPELLPGEMGTISYDPAISPPPQGDWIYGVTERLFRFAEQRCSELNPDSVCALDITELHVDIRIIPYADFEQLILDWWEQDYPTEVHKLYEDGTLIAGLSRQHFGRREVYYYQYPSDRLIVHEMLHLIYPAAEEPQIVSATLEFITSRFYKDWLRERGKHGQ